MSTMHRINSSPAVSPTGESTLERAKKAKSAQERGRKALVTATAGAAAVGAFLGIGAFYNKQDSAVKARYARAEIEALNSMNRGEAADIAWNSVVVLQQGAAIRKAPIEGTDEVSYKIKAGEVLRIDRPRTYIDDNNKLWLVFTDSSKGGSDGGANDPNRNYWLDYDGLKQQSESENHPYITVYNYAEKSQPIGLPKAELDVTVNGQNQAVASLGKSDVVIGQASTIPKDVFSQMAQQEGLTIDQSR